jgi:hypothetical protein
MSGIRDGVGRDAVEPATPDTPQELEREVQVLRQRLAELEVAPPPHRVRRVATAVLTLLTVVGVVATTVAVWQTRTALDTGRFMSVVGPVLETPEVTDAIRARLTDEVLVALAIDERLEARLSDLDLIVSDELADALDLTPLQRTRIGSLPLPQLQDLAAPIASGLEGRITARIDRFVSSPRFQSLLVEGAALAHTEAVALLRGDHERLPAGQMAAGEVRLDLLPAIATVLEDLVDEGLDAVGIDAIPFIDPFADPEASLARLSDALGTELPPDLGQLTVMSEDELSELQSLASAADRLVWVLATLTLLLLAVTIGVAPRRRRTLLQLALGTGVGLVITMLLLRSTEDEIAGTAATPEGRDALALLAHATFDSLRSSMLVVLAVALAVAAVSYLAGRPPWVGRGVAAVRAATEPRPGGSDLQRFVVRHHDGLRVAVIAVATGLLVLLGLGLWTVLVLAASTLLALWGLTTIRDRG